ncbi:MAG: tetratricopeptide repeat protein, partial [Thermoanaerobaculia bacterium]|nr:tetratricopeptide repeat protein [Thermoanaerobaculia bacterium]
AILESGLQQHPAYADALSSLGYCHLALAEWQDEEGLDSSTALEGAVAAYRATVAAAPDHLYAYNNLAITLRSLGEAANRRGEPYEDFFEQALVATDRALELNPSYANAMNSRGQILRSSANALGLGCHDDVEPLLAAARAAHLGAAEIRPDVWQYPSNEAKAWLDSAEHAAIRGAATSVFLSGSANAIERAEALWKETQTVNRRRLEELRRGEERAPPCVERSATL